MNLIAMQHKQQWQNQTWNWLQEKWKTWRNEVTGIALYAVAVVVCGLLFGAVIATQLNPAIESTLSTLMGQFLSAVQGHHLVSPDVTFWQRTFFELKVFALVWLVGLSLLGPPLVTAILFLYSLRVGFSVAYAVIQFGWHGFLVASLVIFVHELFALSCLSLACVVAIRLSSTVMRKPVSLGNLPLKLISYTGLVTLCFAGASIGAAYQAFVAPSLLQALLT